MTLLEELPSDFPILLLGTSSVPLAEIEAVEPSSIFLLRNVYAHPSKMPSFNAYNGDSECGLCEKLTIAIVCLPSCFSTPFLFT